MFAELLSAESGRRPPWRRARALLRDETGSAALEFISVGLLMLVPLLYLIVALGAVQAQSLGVEAAARHTARAIALAANAPAAGERADAIIAAVAREYDIDPEGLQVTIACVPAASVCPEAGATVVVTVAARVMLPLVPSVLGLDDMVSVPVLATSAQKVSRFWGTEP